MSWEGALIRRGLMSVVLLLTLATSVGAAERIKLPLFGVSLVLPEGWIGKVPPAPDVIKADKHTFQTQIEASCTSAACAISQDTCEVMTYDDIIDLWDIASNALLFPTKGSMDETTQIILKKTSKGATVAKPLGREVLGQNTWFTLETTAARGFKSVLHARAVVHGRFLWALCRTCATGESRFQTARALLASIMVDAP
ncbi:hypothetical protein [Lichenihabitans psoromatis]|uniref:hypothetical protein n=1 Tax=Lichenihabitans psoromatis TaxID=2528642 RepID=UPI001035F936|nr:hypothetical protein [Lichenihabitans psoromatis]